MSKQSGGAPPKYAILLLDNLRIVRSTNKDDLINQIDVFRAGSRPFEVLKYNKLSKCYGISEVVYL